MSTKWEYLSFWNDEPSDEWLTEMGAQGWELVSIAYSQRKDTFFLVFKREAA